jgi:hypothetical protein
MFMPFFIPAALPTGISFVGGASTGGVTASGTLTQSLTSLTGGISSAPIAGDIVLVFYAIERGDTGLNLTIDTIGYTTLTTLFSNDINESSLIAGWKIMGATPDTSVTCSDTYSGLPVIATLVFRGVNQTTPIDVTTTTATGNNSCLATPPAISPNTSGSVVVSIGAGSSDSASTTSVLTSTDFTQFLSVVDQTSGTPSSIMGIGFLDSWVSGIFTPSTFTSITLTDSSKDAWTAASLVLRPA